jgi:hypothetical protein
MYFIDARRRIVTKSLYGTALTFLLHSLDLSMINVAKYVYSISSFGVNQRERKTRDKKGR